MTETQRRLFFAATFALVFYLVGASFVESFVTYRTWRFVGAGSFPAYYAELAPRIVRVMVLPGVVEIALTVALLCCGRAPFRGGRSRLCLRSISFDS
jgi:hypothetical protein